MAYEYMFSEISEFAPGKHANHINWKINSNRTGGSVHTPHYIYALVFRFSPHQQEVCDDNYKKKCTIVFVTQSQTEMVRIQALIVKTTQFFPPTHLLT